MFIGALFVIAQHCWKQPKYSSAGEWITTEQKTTQKKKKGMNDWYMLQHEWILRWTEAKLKEEYLLYESLYIKFLTNTLWQKVDQRGRVGSSEKEHLQPSPRKLLGADE